MNAELKRFDEAVKSDPKMQDEIKSAVKDNQGLVSFANERGYNFTMDDLNGAASELNPEDLDQVSGGAAPPVAIILIAPVIVII